MNTLFDEPSLKRNNANHTGLGTSRETGLIFHVFSLFLTALTLKGYPLRRLFHRKNLEDGFTVRANGNILDWVGLV
jgi:hypothetical protein